MTDTKMNINPYFCSKFKIITVMNLEQRKYQFIEEYTKLYNPDIIEKFEQLLKEVKARQAETEKENDEKAINEGLKQLDDGEFLTRSQVRNKVKEKYNF
jgi:L-lactate utilization protein LutC